GGRGLGVLVRPRALATYRLGPALKRRGIPPRLALASLQVGAAESPAGTIFTPRLGNPADLDRELADLLARGPLVAQRIDSSFEVNGTSLGSPDMPAIRPVRVGLLSGEGVDATSFGFLWHLLDREIDVHHDRLDLARLAQVDLSEIDVLVLPDGDYDDHISEKTRQALDVWVKDGGILVAIGDAVTWLQDHQMTAVKKWEA